MFYGTFWRRAVGGLGAVLAVVALAEPIFAQGSQGIIRGNVFDADGQPIQGARITISRTDGSARFETTSNAKGEYMQAVTYSGGYLILCEKEKIGSASYQASVKIGAWTTVNCQLIVGQLAKQQLAEMNKALKQLQTEALAAANAGNHQVAISKFNQMIAQSPKCSSCYYNLGVSQSKLKDWGAAEAAFKQAIELRADYTDAYNALAEAYNAQRKVDLAAAAAAKAAELGAAAGASGGGSAETLYVQGTILWNAGKLPEATVQFEQALKADPNFAPAHYHYGMALLNQGKLPEALAEFDTYVKLAPTGEYAAQAKAMIGQLKK
jgi:tetratricopeptide (TPR) repeat protein